MKVCGFGVAVNPSKSLEFIWIEWVKESLLHGHRTTSIEVRAHSQCICQVLNPIPHPLPEEPMHAGSWGQQTYMEPPEEPGGLQQLTDSDAQAT